MKKTLRMVLAAFMAVAMVTFVSCGKEDDGGNGTEQPTPTPNPNPQPTVNWVDLGLPSGLLWAEYNVGANAPEEFGDYFSWGESQPKINYNGSTYRYGTVDGDGVLVTLTKYNTSTDFGLVDSLITLQPSDDAASVLLGNGARTPTKEEWQELLDNTTAEYATINNVNGCKFTAVNGKSIFLPNADYHSGSVYSSTGNDYGFYWSASLNTDYPNHAWYFYFDYVNTIMNPSQRYLGYSVRAVRDR